MASVIDAFNDAFSDKLAYLKFFLYAIPVYFCSTFFIKGQMSYFYMLGAFTLLLLLSALSRGISNIRCNRKEILTLNPFTLIWPLIKLILVLVPQILICYWVGNFILQYAEIIPVEIPHVNQIIGIVVWTVLGSILLTSFLSYSKSLSIIDGYDLRTIFASCIDVIVVLLFGLPQIAIADAILIGPVAYVYWAFHWPFDHFTFIAYCSMVFVLNLSVLADYLAQVAYENVKTYGKDEGGDFVVGSVIANMEEDTKNKK